MSTRWKAQFRLRLKMISSFCRRWGSGWVVQRSSRETIMTNVQTKTKVKQKQSLSRPARRELKLAPEKVKNVSRSCTLMVAVGWKWGSHHNIVLPWTAKGGNTHDLLTWESHHCGPGGASWLTANRDRVNVLGAGQPGHIFHTWLAFFPILCSEVPHGRGPGSLASVFNYRPVLVSLFETRAWEHEAQQTQNKNCKWTIPCQKPAFMWK